MRISDWSSDVCSSDLGMRRQRLIKNARFETVLELFKDARAGSGQIDISGLDHLFDVNAPGYEDDKVIIESLAEAASFDVYLLRLTLRSPNNKVAQAPHMRVSPKRSEKLQEKIGRT